MSIRIGINGFGRIGRNIFRAIDKDPAFADIEVVAINDLTSNATTAHLLKYDSIMGVYDKAVAATEKGITVNGRQVDIYNHRNPADIPWGAIGVDYVVESTGYFTNDETSGAHLEAGAKKVIISAPAKGKVKTIVMGVNDDEYDPLEHNIISNASCTTNCLAPVAKVI
ncbi:MAG: type I glyceraldehyde-3-phosphate dehydrogenase, partial [Desulfobacteraceae bacterium]|nr:type I glyceraldehyde-3-phosphate dehydrogenase [Desulfobacteraceae bacterium]